MWCTEILIINRKTPKMIFTHVIQPDRYINGGKNSHIGPVLWNIAGKNFKILNNLKKNV